MIKRLGKLLAWPGQAVARLSRRRPVLATLLVVAVVVAVFLIPAAVAKEDLTIAQANKKQYDACIRQGLDRQTCQQAYGGGGSGGGNSKPPKRTKPAQLPKPAQTPKPAKQRVKCQPVCDPCTTCQRKGKPCKKKCNACATCLDSGRAASGGGSSRGSGGGSSRGSGGGSSRGSGGGSGGGKAGKQVPGDCKLTGKYYDFAAHPTRGFSKSNTRATYHYYAPNYETSSLACADKFHAQTGYGPRLLKYPWMAFCAKGDKPWDSSVCGKCYKVTNRRTGAGVIARAVDQGGCTDSDGKGLDLDPCAFNAIDTDGQGMRDGNMRVDVQEVQCAADARL